MIIMTLRGARNNPLMSEGAGGAEVPKALFYFARSKYAFEEEVYHDWNNCGSGDPSHGTRRVDRHDDRGKEQGESDGK